MAEHWQELVANLAVVALFISTWVHGQFVFAGTATLAAQARLRRGHGAWRRRVHATRHSRSRASLFDLRLSLIAIARFFGGPMAGCATVSDRSGLRVGVIGGPNAGLAPLSIMVT